jgi:hypothetical protein
MVDTRNVKIYVLKHPDTNEIRYVGKTVRSLSRRLGNHIANAKGNKHNKHLSNWILSILKDNKRPIIELIEECHYSVWQEREIFWISQFDNLINLTKGGDGCKGFIHDAVTIGKLKKINLGKKHTQEFKDNMSKRLKGVPFTKEHKENISKSLKGKKASEETKKKSSEAHKGIVQSEESKRKRSESIKEWWRKRKSSKDIVKSE